MAKWLSKDVIVNGLKMHYYRSGGEKPPFVLAHGATDDGLCWTAVAEALSETYDVVMVDALGHGLSDSPDGPNPVENMGNQLAATIEALGIELPLIMGHSMGAATAIALAGLHPDLPKAILLEDPPSWWKPVEPPSEESADAGRGNRMMEWFESLRSKTREEILADGRVQNPTWPEEEFGPWADSKMRFVAHDVEKPAFSRESPPYLADMMAKISCTTLLIYADKGITTEADAVLFKEIVPQAVVKQIKDAGHNIRREQYQEFMATVEKFLSEVE